MHDPVADELRVCQGRDHGKDPFLLREPEMGLEPHQVIHRPGSVVLSQLDHRVGISAGLGIGQAHGLQGPVAEGVLAPAGHDLHRHTAFKDLFVLKAVDRGLLGGGQLPDKGLVLGLIHGAVDIIRSSPVVPGGKPGLVHVDGLRRHQWRGSVVEVQITGPAEVVRDGGGQGLGGQGACGDDDRPFGNGGELRLLHPDVGVGADFLRHHPGKALPVHSQTAAGLHLCGVGAGENQTVQPPQLLLEEPHGVFQPVSPQGVGADQLRKVRAVMGGGHFQRLHFHQADLQAPLGQLPGGLASREPRAHHRYA